MKWYLAKIVFRIICGNGHHTAQFDEQLRLINADDKAAAFAKAKVMGQNEEDCFMNIHQQPVQWKFINVAEIYTLDEMTDGAEMFSRIYESGDGEAYINMINRKAMQLSEAAENIYQ